MATVLGTDGVSYHLWGLADASAPEPEDSHEFTVLENEMSEGFRSRSLFGMNTGVREWNLEFPTLAGSSIIAAALTDPYGATVSREQYVRNVYKHNRTTGTPFAYPDPNHNGQYYLVDMVTDELTMKKMKGVGIYNTTLTFRQRRLAGVSVFDPTKLRNYSALHWYNETSHGAGVWNDKQATSPKNLTAGGDVVFSSNAFDGKNTVRMSGSATTGTLSVSTSLDIADTIIVFKLRAASAGTASIIHPDTGGSPFPILRTFSASTALTTLFTMVVTGNEDVNNQFAIVQVLVGSYIAAIGTPILWGIGANVIAGSNHAKADIAELWISSTPMSRRDSQEAAEHLGLKWGLI